MPTTRCAVPPEHPSYALRRLWLDAADYDAYYGGFANEGLWPLCHLVDVRPQFRSDDWAAYQDGQRPIRRGHRRGAGAATPKRRSSSRTTIWRWSPPGCANGGRRRARRCSGTSRGRIPIGCGSARGGARSSPGCWPTTWWRFSWSAIGATSCWPSRRSSTPRSKPTASGSGSRPRLHRDRRADRRGLRPDPGRRRATRRCRRSSSGCARRSGCTAPILGLGVDRLDYTKGIPERLEALDRCSRAGPSLRGRLTFVQIGVPSRSSLDSYSAIESAIDRKVDEVNARHGSARRCRRRSTTTRRRCRCPAWSRSIASRISASSARCTTA